MQLDSSIVCGTHFTSDLAGGKAIVRPDWELALILSSLNTDTTKTNKEDERCFYAFSTVVGTK